MKFLDRAIWRLVDGILLTAVLGMVLLIGLQVGTRLLGNSLPWTEELSRFLFIWTIWFGLAAGFRNGQHPRVTIFSDLPTGRTARRVIDFLPGLATALLFAVVTRHGWDLLWQQIRFGETSAILQIGMWIASVPVVLGGALAVVGAIVHALIEPDPVSFSPEMSEPEVGPSKAVIARDASSKVDLKHSDTPPLRRSHEDHRSLFQEGRSA
ncbi:TRAP transporter small permease [Celeribacter sp. ULVN23_4]